MKRVAILRRQQPTASTQVDPTACEVCAKPYFRFNSMQKVCGARCAAKVPAIARKAEREADKAQREKLKKRSKWEAEALQAFNAFIRARDADLPCICCGQWASPGELKGGEWDSGHYRSRGAARELRFDENNAHRQLKRCNRRAWDVAGYRANLIGRIGLPAVEALEGPHPATKYTIDDLKALIPLYRAKANAITKENT